MSKGSSRSAKRCRSPRRRTTPNAPRKADPELRSQRTKTDEVLTAQVQRVSDQNFEVYGVRTVWRQMHREEFTVARCTVQRLTKQLGLKGVIRGKPCARR